MLFVGLIVFSLCIDTTAAFDNSAYHPHYTADIQAIDRLVEKTSVLKCSSCINFTDPL